MSHLILMGIAIAVVAGISWWTMQKSRRRTHRVLPGHHPEIDLPHTEEFELYHNALSLCSMKTRVCLAELGVAYKSHHIDLIETGCYENIRPRLLDVNPGGTVPVLVHAGHPVYESHEQIRYAADHAPPGAPSLVPVDPALNARMQRFIDLSSLTDDPINHGDESAGNAVPGQTLPLFCTMVEKIPLWKIAEGLLFHFDKKRPLLFMILKLRGIDNFHRLGPLVKMLKRSRRQMATHLDTLEKELEQSGGPFVLGQTFSLADVSWLVIFERLEQVAALDGYVGESLRPQCARYWDALKARPSYALAILEHSHPIIDFGTQRIREAKAANPAVRACLEDDGRS